MTASTVNPVAPKVSVLMVTYNHERYIARALESVFAQQHDYSLEIVVGDDASTDRTNEIVTGYSLRYPGVIKVIRHTTNVGHCRNYFAVLEAAQGEYVALLDGDDYWTDPLKLKRQVSFLDEHPEFVLSSHRFQRYYPDRDRFEGDLCPELYEANPAGFVMDPCRFFTHWAAQTVTVMVRRSAADLDEFRKYKYFADVHFFFSVLQKGKGYAHSFFGAVYVTHGDGIWSKLNERQRLKMNYNIMAELRQSYPHDIHLRRAYVLQRHNLIWMDYERLRADGKLFRCIGYMLRLGVHLLLFNPHRRPRLA